MKAPELGLISEEEFEWLRMRSAEVSGSSYDLSIGMLAIGTRDGLGSVRAMLLGGRGMLVCVDPCPDQDVFVEFLRNTWGSVGKGRVVICRAKAEEAYRFKLPDEARYRFIFADGDHSLETTRLDLEYGWSHLAPRGILAWHDDVLDTVRRAALEVFPGGYDRFRSIGWKRGPAAR
jgi:hypothetical protein